MVSTRQMSTTGTSQNGPGDEGCAKFSVTNKHSNSSLSTLSSNKSVGNVSVINCDISQEKESPERSIYLLDLPIEILDKIFTYVGYKKIGQLRVVSSQMNQVCSAILNSTFSKLQTQMLNRFQTVKAKMPRRESARRNHPLACECDIIETCYMRLSLLQMTFGKHIERKHCCFFPGGILDEVYNVLNYIRITPKLERPYRVTDELFDLSTMAMEYFKEYIEPSLPEIAYFRKDFFDLKSKSKTNYSLKVSSELSENASSMPSPPQSNMVLRKGIRKIKQGMKMYNNQLTVLRSELRNCKRKSSEQGKQIAEQQKLLADQQKQTLEYANRLDENDKKNEEISRKFSTLLQELNKCKTELQYWRSKSPATHITCTSCGQKIAPVAPEDFQALINQGVKPEDINISIDDVDETELATNSLIDSSSIESRMKAETIIADGVRISKTITKLSNVSVLSNSLKRRLDEKPTITASLPSAVSATITSGSCLTKSTINEQSTNPFIAPLNLDGVTNIMPDGCSMSLERRIVGDNTEISGNNFLKPTISLYTSNDFTSFNNVSSDIKKARRVQNKANRCYNVSNKRSK